MTVTREGDAMYVQLIGQPPFQTWAEAEDEFFLRVVDAQLSFVKGAGGATSSLVLHQNGANQPARKAVGARNDLVLLAVE